MSEGIYNKRLDNGKGTLVGNWQEERELREFTGAGRYYSNYLFKARIITFMCAF
jgi:hypothetical protein